MTLIVLGFLLEIESLTIGVLTPSLHEEPWIDLVRGANLAVEQIKKKRISNLSVQLAIKETNCKLQNGYAEANNLVKEHLDLIAIVGDSCYDASLGATFISNSYNLMQLLTTTPSMEFSNKKNYPILSRAGPSGLVGLEVNLEFLRQNQFRRIAIFYSRDSREARDQFIDLVSVLDDDIELAYVRALPSNLNLELELDLFAADAGHNTRVIFLQLSLSDIQFFWTAICFRSQGLSTQTFRPVEDYIFIFTGQQQPLPPDGCEHIKFMFVNIPIADERITNFTTIWSKFTMTNSFSNVAIYAYDAILAVVLAAHKIHKDLKDNDNIDLIKNGTLLSKEIRSVSSSFYHYFYADDWILDVDTGDRLMPANLNLITNGTVRKVMTWFPSTRNVTITSVLNELPIRGFPPDQPELNAERTNVYQVTWRWFPIFASDTPIRSIFSYYGSNGESYIQEISQGILEYQIGLSSNQLDDAHCGSIIIETSGGFSEPTDIVCSDCLPGNIVQLDSNDGIRRCIPCPKGTFALLGICERCPPGTFNAAIRSTECSFCNLNEYSPISGAVACLLCPENSIRFFGRDSIITEEELINDNEITDCSCREGFYPIIPNKTGVPCEECPKGGICHGGIASPYPKKGYWGIMSTTTKIKFHECQDNRCKGGTDFACFNKLKGRLCNEVIKNQAFFFAGRKYPCLGSTVIKRKLFGLLLVASACISWLFINFLSSKYLILDIALRNAQLAAQIFQIFSIPWPRSVNKILGSALTFLSFEVDLVSPNCFIQYRSHHRLVWQLTLTGMFVVYYHLWIFYIIIFRWRIIVSNQGGLNEMFDHYNGLFGVTYSRTIRQLISILLIQHPTITEASFANFHCRDLDPAPVVMNEDASIKCSSARRTAMVILSTLVITVYTIGLPLSIALYLRYKEVTAHGLHEEHIIARFGIVFEYYLTHKSIVAFLLYQRTTLVVIIGTFFATAKVQLILTMLLIFFSVVLMTRLPFFKNWRLATTEFVLLTNSISICISGLLLILNSKKNAISLIFFSAGISASIIFILFIYEALDIHRQAKCYTLLRTYSKNKNHDDPLAIPWIQDMATRYRRGSSSLTLGQFTKFELWFLGFDVKRGLPLPLKEVTQSFNSKYLYPLLKCAIQNDDNENLSPQPRTTATPTQIWSIAQILCPFVVDSSPISFYSSDSRASHWRALATVPGLLDYVCFKISDHQRKVLFSVLVDLQRHKKNLSSESSAYRLVTNEDRGALLYAMCSIHTNEYIRVRNFIVNLDPSKTQHLLTRKTKREDEENDDDERPPHQSYDTQQSSSSSSLKLSKRVSRISLFRQVSTAQVHGSMQAAQSYLELQENEQLSHFVDDNPSNQQTQSTLDNDEENNNDISMKRSSSDHHSSEDKEDTTTLDDAISPSCSSST